MQVADHQVAAADRPIEGRLEVCGHVERVLPSVMRRISRAAAELGAVGQCEGGAGGKVDTTDFDNVKDQIGCCGIWCGSCVVGNGVLRQLTGKYREIAEAYGLREWAAKGFDYDEFAKGLYSIESMPSCSGCLKGGGREDCVLRSCVLARGLRDCTECDSRGDCAHAGLLEHMRSGALAAGLFVRQGEEDRQALLEGWLARIVSHWPSSLLF